MNELRAVIEQLAVAVNRPAGAESILDFCRSEGISRAGYYVLKKQGKTPREMQVGRKIRISPEAKADWRRDREIERQQQLAAAAD